MEEYSDKVKLRLKQMKKVWHDERRAKEAAYREQLIKVFTEVICTFLKKCIPLMYPFNSNFYQIIHIRVCTYN